MDGRGANLRHRNFLRPRGIELHLHLHKWVLLHTLAMVSLSVSWTKAVEMLCDLPSPSRG
jgi:hypothetical protein